LPPTDAQQHSISAPHQQHRGKRSQILRKKIGKRLRQERERLGMSQTEFAGIGNASARSQAMWETGNAVPNAEFLAMGADESAFLQGFRALDLRGKDVIFGILAAMDIGASAAPPEFARTMRLIKAFRDASEQQKVQLETLAACRT
jgi:transcriptional regulator with XRE-family HTH domain